MKIAIILIYAIGMLAIGFIGRNKSKSTKEFFLCDRNVGPWVSAFAYGTAYFSAVLFIGYAGKQGWGYGIHTMWIVIGNAMLGSWLAWKLLAARTRDMTIRLGAITMPEFLEGRYGSRTLKILAATIIFIFLVPYTAAVYMGLSYLFEMTLQIQYIHALIFMAALTGCYLIMGGYYALTLTDFVQGLVMLIGVIVMVTALVGQQGGLIHATQSLMNPEFAPGLKEAGAIPGWLTLLSLVFVTSFGPWGMPQMVQKFYAIKSRDAIKPATIVVTLFSLIIAFGAYYTGALTHLFYAVPPANLDNLMPLFLTQFAPPWITLLIMMLVLAASMSTLSSLVLVSASAVAVDIYAGNGKRSDRSTVALMRLLCAGFVVLSCVLALKQPAVIADLMIIAWGTVAGSFLAPYIYGLFWRRANTAGAFAGLITGLFTSVFLYIKLGKPGIPLAGTIAILLPLAVMPLVTILTRPMPQEHTERVYGEVGQPVAEKQAVAEA